MVNKHSLKKLAEKLIFDRPASKCSTLFRFAPVFRTSLLCRSFTSNLVDFKNLLSNLFVDLQCASCKCRCNCNKYQQVVPSLTLIKTVDVLVLRSNLQSCFYFSNFISAHFRIHVSDNDVNKRTGQCSSIFQKVPFKIPQVCVEECVC